jgi:hypothetical protein
MFQVEKFNIRIVNAGDAYGRKDCLINDSEQMIEFYDSRFDQDDWMGRGQFVSRYYTKTILGGKYPNGLCLDDPRNVQWIVSAEAMNQVIEFIKQQ